MSRRPALRPVLTLGVVLALLGLVPPLGSRAAASGAVAAAPDGWSVVERPVVARTNRVSVVMLVPQGSSPSFSRADVVRSVQDVAAYYARETDGRLRLELEQVVDWMPLDVDYPCTWTGALLDWAEPRIGWSRAEGRHLVAMVPSNGSCPGWANGELGAWVGAGGRAFQPSPDHNFLVHELGHNLSLPHATSVQCDDTWDFGTRTSGVGVPERCTREEYGNLLDMMGGSWTLDDALSSPYLDRLGMLPRYYTPRCGAERRLTVTAIVQGAEQRRAVSWTDPRDPGVRYWADFRSGWRTGVQLLRTDPQEAIASTALVRPGDGGDRRQLLRVGEQVTLGGGTRVRLDDVATDGRSGTLAIAVPCAPSSAPEASRTVGVAERTRVAHGAQVGVAVTVSGPLAEQPGGVVTLRDEGTVVATARLESGTARVLVPTGRLSIGRHTLAVAYEGDERHGSSAAAVSLEVERATSRTRVSVSAPGTRGAGAVARVQVQRAEPGPLPRTVRVSLWRGGRQVTARTLTLQDGAARWSLPRLARGSHRVVAVLSDTATTVGSRGSAGVRR